MALHSIHSTVCSPASLKKRELFTSRCRHIRLGWKLNLANAHLWSRVPIDQIAFFFNVKHFNVEAWVKASHKRKPLGWSKWRPELDLYEIAGVDWKELS